jgi:6-pyruvoyltetrahydropterin/6-carboxytetrahydropterin synthase
MDCPICKATGIDNMIGHIADIADDTHLDALNPIIIHTYHLAKICFTFEIVEELSLNTVVSDFIAALLVDKKSLTSLISRLIPVLGYDRRKCAGVFRKATNVTEKNLTETELLLSVKPQLLNICKASVTPQPIVNTKFTNINVRMDSDFIELSKSFSFSAVHHIPEVSGVSQYTHGHDWHLNIVVVGKVSSDTNMVIHFSDISDVVNACVINILDHSYLNDIIWNPTVENICMWIKEELINNGITNLHRVELKDSIHTCASIELWKQGNN